MTTAVKQIRRLAGRFLVVLILVAAAGALAPSAAHAAAPSNDNVENALALSGLPATTSVNTSEATYAQGDPGCGVATVWYTFTPATDGPYQIDTIGSDYDTTLAVLEGSPGNLNVIACNDDRFGLQSGVNVNLTGSTTYYVQGGTCCGEVDVGVVGPGGNLVVNVQAGTPPADVELTVDRLRVGAQQGTVDVSGTVTCNTTSGVFVFGEVRQRQGRNLNLVTFFTFVNCENSTVTWTATSSVGTQIFQPTSAAVSAGAQTCDIWSCDNDEVASTVKFRKK